MHSKTAVVLWILCLVCFLYGIAAFRARSGTGFYLIWFVIALFVGILALMFQKGLWKFVPTGLRIVLGIVLAVVILVSAVTEGFIISGFSSKAPAGLDYIIVLGAQVRESGPSVVLRFRLDEAYEYLTRNPDTVCIVSGGQGANEPETEAAAMKKYLAGKGVSDERLIEEDKSRNTAQNITNSYEFVPDGSSVGIVSNDFHVFRAEHIASKTAKKLNLTLKVYGLPADSDIRYLPNNMLREMLGVWKDIAEGNM